MWPYVPEVPHAASGTRHIVQASAVVAMRWRRARPRTGMMVNGSLSWFRTVMVCSSPGTPSRLSAYASCGYVLACRLRRQRGNGSACQSFVLQVRYRCVAGRICPSCPMVPLASLGPETLPPKAHPLHADASYSSCFSHGLAVAVWTMRPTYGKAPPRRLVDRAAPWM